jgi:rare lipoprotein A
MRLTRNIKAKNCNNINTKKYERGKMSKGISLILTLSFIILGCSNEKKIRISKARFKATMKPYTIDGKTYHPTYVKVGDTMKGISSWYGPNFHGKYTSSGEVYNMYGMTAAHKTWPMNTIVLVENLNNGKSVVVRINDRGPFVDGRVIDCSYSAGKALGLDKSGIAKVKLTVLGFAGKIYKPDPNSKKAPPKVKLKNFGVQIGAFKKLSSAKKMKKRFKINGKKVEIKKFDDAEGLYRVWVTGFKSEDEAKAFIKEHNITGTVIIGV